MNFGKNKYFKGKKAGVLMTFLFVGMTFGIAYLMLSTNVSNVFVEQEMKIVNVREWRPQALASSGNTSCFVYFVHWPHAADPGTTYASNLTYTNAYEYTTSLDSEMTGETPYDTVFDTVLKFKVNASVGYSTGNTTWMTTWVRANETCSELSLTDQAFTIIQIATSGADYAYYHAYLQDSDGGAGSGFTITHGQTVNHSSITADGFW